MSKRASYLFFDHKATRPSQQVTDGHGMALARSWREDPAGVQLGCNATQAKDADRSDIVNDWENVLGVTVCFGDDLGHSHRIALASAL